MHDIRIRPARFDEPAVAALLVDVLAELSERYGGSGDDTPVSPDDFAPPNGAFFVVAEVVAVPVSVAAPEMDLVVAEAGPAERGSAAVEAGPAAGTSVERLIGCAGWRRHGDDAELKRMYTAKAARGRGLGRRLLATIEESAREAGCKRVILETGDRQPEAIALYESAGYLRIEDFGFYAGEDGVLSFAKPL